MFFWQKLLEKWCKTNTGLTIPYIIGSQKILNEDYELNAANDITRIFNEILENTGTVFYLNHCPNLSEPVLGIKDEDFEDMIGEFLTTREGLKQEKLFICQSMFIHFPKKQKHTIEDVVEWLISKYSSQIENKQYSKNKRQWGDYLPEEITFIKNVVK